MKRRKRPSPWAVASDRADMLALAQEYMRWLEVHQYTEPTVKARYRELTKFLGWCTDRGLTAAHEVTRPILERYQRHLFYYRKANGEPLSINHQKDHLVCVKQFFRWLARENYVLYNPASDLDMPKVPQRLPGNVLTAEEVDRILNLADVATPIGLRDRAIMETFYSTGIRRSELARLKLNDVDLIRGLVFVHQGKGRKDRIIPIGDRAVAWIEKYLQEARARFVMEPDEGYLFVTRMGGGFCLDGLTGWMQRYIEQAGIGKQGACHIFRHTMATLMLENGADIRYVQAMLGHSDLNSTQVYTHVAVGKLKEIHNATHPAKLERKSQPG